MGGRGEVEEVGGVGGKWEGELEFSVGVGGQGLKILSSDFNMGGTIGIFGAFEGWRLEGVIPGRDGSNRSITRCVATAVRVHPPLGFRTPDMNACYGSMLSGPPADSRSIVALNHTDVALIAPGTVLPRLKLEITYTVLYFKCSVHFSCTS